MRDLITQRSMVTVRVMMEAVTDPASSAEYHARVIDPFREQASEMVRRAIERGELALQTPVDRVFELVWGATLTHVMVTPSQHRDSVLDGADAFAVDVVDVVLAGVRAQALRRLTAAAAATSAAEVESGEPVSHDHGREHLAPLAVRLAAHRRHAVVCCLAQLGLRRLAPQLAKGEHNDVAGFVIAVVGVIYAVMLGFVVIVTWEKFVARRASSARRPARCATSTARARRSPTSNASSSGPTC